MRICEMRDREVINICTCRRLGYVADVEFDPEKGCITAFIVPGPARIWGCLGRDTEYVIPFSCVRQIGGDIILVDVKVEEILQKCEGF